MNKTRNQLLRIIHLGAMGCTWWYTSQCKGCPIGYMCCNGKGTPDGFKCTQPQTKCNECSKTPKNAATHKFVELYGKAELVKELL